MTTASLRHIDLTALPIGQQSLEYKLDSAFFQSLEQDDILGGECSVKVLLNAGEISFKFHVEIQGRVQVVCDRCLDAMDLTLEPIAEDVLFKLADEDGEDENAIYINRNNPFLDLGWQLYEMIDVHLPIVHSHEPGQCNPEMEKLLQEHLATDEI